MSLNPFGIYAGYKSSKATEVRRINLMLYYLIHFTLIKLPSDSVCLPATQEQNFFTFYSFKDEWIFLKS